MGGDAFGKLVGKGKVTECAITGGFPSNYFDAHFENTLKNTLMEIKS